MKALIEAIDVTAKDVVHMIKMRQKELEQEPEQ